MFEKVLEELSNAKEIFIQIDDGDVIITEFRMGIIDIVSDKDSISIAGDKTNVYCEGEVTYDEDDKMYIFTKGNNNISIGIKH